MGRANAKAIDLLTHHHATAGWLIQELTARITALEAQLADAKAREVDLVERLWVLNEVVKNDPGNICVGVPDAAIWAGIEAWDAAKHDMENYVSGETADWDEGMIVAAIFKAVIHAIIREQP